VPAAAAGSFPAEGSHLERYADRFNAVEINSSFYRPHRRTTYERWAASVPEGFRFAVKLPRAITHERRLLGCGDLLRRFADETAGLGRKRGPILVQLPPSFAFDPAPIGAFLAELRETVDGPIALEPRHPSWFDGEADALLAAHQVARVAADPARVPAAGIPGGWPGLVYARWHGSPDIYRSDYDSAAITAHARLIRATIDRGAESWTIYDNTTFGRATANALSLGDSIPNAR
jgi:uncharacterized protein YecE (DUF72 family)